MAGSGILQLRTGLRDLPSTAGFFVHGSRGAVWDLKMVDQRQTTPAHQRGDNPLITYFQNHPAPKLEYVFNVYQRPFIASIGAVSIAINQNPARIESNLGDGVVSLASAAGKMNANDPSIWNGGASGSQFVDPVIYGVWPGLDHLSAPSDANSLIKSLDGVPYHWDGNATSDWPAYAHMYGENQSFGKYFKTPSFGSTAYTDEPGIDQMKLYISHPGNPLLIDSKNTWDTGTGLPIKRYTNQTDLVGHQIITGSSSVVKPICTVGVKNHSQTPVASSSAHWIQAGNEYLPASLVVAFQSDSLPLQTNNAYQIVVYVRANGKGFNPDYCLVQYDASGNVAFQYGIGQSQFNFPLSASDNKVFFAAQGCNMAGLVTPQVEQVFNAPVNSETVVAILQKINQGEALSNGCHNATMPTRWTASIREWGTTDTGTITLNFFPTRTNLNIVDAWITNSVFNDFTFDPPNKKITINDANAAPSQLIVNYTAYLGCDKMFTNSDNGYVPALGKDTLAGVPIDEAFVTQIRTAAKGVFDKYRNIHTNGCVAWTKVDILNRVLSSNEWSTITGHLVTQNHFTELQNVLTELMTEPLTCCCASVTIAPANLPPAMLNTSYSDNLNAGGGMASYTFAVTSNSLPTGMTYSNADTSMVITGVPTVYGSNTFVITATDTNGCWTNAVCNLFVDCGPVVYLDPALNSETTYELPSGSNNVYYTATINVTNWPSSYAFTYSGSLPDGLSTNSTSRSITITGTPTTAGLSAFTLTATDTNGCSTNQTYSITINSGSCLNCSDVYTIDFDWVMNEDGKITSNHCTWIVGNAYTQDCTWLNFFSPACGNLWDMDGPFLTAGGINWDSKWPCSGPSGKTSGSTTCPPGTFAGYFLDCSYGGQTWTINYSNVVVR